MKNYSALSIVVLAVLAVAGFLFWGTAADAQGSPPQLGAPQDWDMGATSTENLIANNQTAGNYKVFNNPEPEGGSSSPIVVNVYDKDNVLKIGPITVQPGDSTNGLGVPFEGRLEVKNTSGNKASGTYTQIS